MMLGVYRSHAAIADGCCSVGLDGAAAIPLVGIPFALINAAISFSNCDTTGTILSLVAVIPFAGDFADAAKAARDAERLTEVAEEGNYVYRGLSDVEAEQGVADGIFARAPGAGNDAVSHVAGKIDSQWISATKSLDVATAK